MPQRKQMLCPQASALFGIENKAVNPSCGGNIEKKNRGRRGHFLKHFCLCIFQRNVHQQRLHALRQ